ncbi:MAG TPA: glycerate kinase, partial [Beutenbergiaceae bacterium]|nr:glycerate kinase [Beutenbergiaceae bacterium]
GQTDFVLAADVNNPLLGETGAAAVYGPQKGAEPATVAELDAALATWEWVLREAGRVEESDARAPGAGAAGGVGYAAIALLGAHREAGVDVVLELTNFAEKVTGADLVITGEGSLDEQSLHGKTPVGVAEAAARAGARTIAVAGRTNLTRDQVRSAGIEDRYQILDLEPDPQVAMSAAGPLLEKLGEQIVADYVRQEQK